MAKRVSARKIKIHTQYTYEHAADVLGVSVQTVRLWRQSGLDVLDSQKPHLILGFALKDFLNKRSNRPERRLARDQFLCMAHRKADSIQHDRSGPFLARSGHSGKSQWLWLLLLRFLG